MWHSQIPTRTLISDQEQAGRVINNCHRAHLRPSARKPEWDIITQEKQVVWKENFGAILYGNMNSKNEVRARSSHRICYADKMWYKQKVGIALLDDPLQLTSGHTKQWSFLEAESISTTIRTLSEAANQIGVYFGRFDSCSSHYTSIAWKTRPDPRVHVQSRLTVRYPPCLLFQSSPIRRL